MPNKTQMVIDGRPVGIPLTESQAILILRWLDSDGVGEALADSIVGRGCGSCVHLRSEHDQETGRCSRDNPTFGPCPCEGWRPEGGPR